MYSIYKEQNPIRIGVLCVASFWNPLRSSFLQSMPHFESVRGPLSCLYHDFLCDVPAVSFTANSAQSQSRLLSRMEAHYCIVSSSCHAIFFFVTCKRLRLHYIDYVYPIHNMYRIPRMHCMHYIQLIQCIYCMCYTHRIDCIHCIQCLLRIVCTFCIRCLNCSK